MGADIHMYVEQRLSPNDKWEPSPLFHERYEDTDSSGNKIMRLNSCFTGRNYEMFGILAGVRGSGCLYEPRGLPSDISEEIAKETDPVSPMMGDHSHTHLSLKEYARCLKKYDKKINLNNIKDLDDQSEYVQLYVKANEWFKRESAEAELFQTGLKPEIRLVFWFDS